MIAFVIAEGRDAPTLGIDEAGRGPILGPLVMAGVVLRPRRAAALTRAGVTDSKAFGAGPEAHAQRAALAARVEAEAEHIELRVVEPAEIDRRVARQELNVLERERAIDIIGKCPPVRRIVLDGARMFSPLCAHFPHAEARDRAESHHVSVAAASIVAKFHRDELFAQIARRYEPEFGPIAGGGYLNAATHRFLDAYKATYGRLPPEARLSWNSPANQLNLF